ncbi:MAG: SiaB family protein kinase [Flavobacteriales bacterium]|nr:SiaB family protein kinase [Flavobacteriales bacterium]
MLDRIYDLYDEMERQRVMLSFKGDLTGDLVTALLGLVERKMEIIEPDPRARKRVFNVVMECLQNLFHHNARLKVSDGQASPTDEPHGVVMIVQSENGYSVLTGNFMAGADVDQLRSHLDRINNLAADQLRDLYRERLSNGQFSLHGGGGLGMIDIARKSGGKLEYGFVPFDTDNAFFSLNVNVTT